MIKNSWPTITNPMTEGAASTALVANPVPDQMSGEIIDLDEYEEVATLRRSPRRVGKLPVKYNSNINTIELRILLTICNIQFMFGRNR